jgi:hypothetical protein
VGRAKVFTPQAKYIMDNQTRNRAGERTGEKPEANPFEKFQKWSDQSPEKYLLCLEIMSA